MSQEYLQQFQQMMRQQPMVRGAFRGLVGNRTSPKLRRILNSKFSEKILENPEKVQSLLEYVISLYDFIYFVWIYRIFDHSIYPRDKHSLFEPEQNLIFENIYLWYQSLSKLDQIYTSWYNKRNFKSQIKNSKFTPLH